MRARTQIDDIHPAFRLSLQNVEDLFELDDLTRTGEARRAGSAIPGRAGERCVICVRERDAA